MEVIFKKGSFTIGAPAAVVLCYGDLSSPCKNIRTITNLWCSLSLSLSLFLFLCLSLSRTLSEALSLLSRDKASHDQGVQFVGRLANCKYINMDEAVDYALGVTESVCRVCVCVCMHVCARERTRASVRARN